MYTLQPVDKCFKVGKNWIHGPVATLADEYGGKCHIVVDDNCYVLYLNGTPSGEFKMTNHIFKEAFLVLKTLGDPKNVKGI